MRRAALWLTLALAAPAVARAQPACPAERDRLEDALNRFQEDDFEGAERGLTFALRSCPTDPSLEGLLGLAQARTGHVVEAERHLQAALASAQHPWIAENRPTLERALAGLQPSLASLVITADAPDAVLHLADDRRVALPASTPVRVQAGSFTLRVVAPGRAPQRRDVAVTPGGTLTLRVELPVDAPAPPPPRRVVVRETSPWRPAGWITAGVGAALVVAGVVQTARASSQATASREATLASDGAWGAWARYRQGFGAGVTADELCAGTGGAGAGASASDLAAVRSLCDDNAATRATALAFTIVGAAVTGAGVAMALLARDRVREESGARVTARVTGEARGLWLTVPF